MKLAYATNILVYKSVSKCFQVRVSTYNNTYRENLASKNRHTTTIMSEAAPSGDYVVNPVILSSISTGLRCTCCVRRFPFVVLVLVSVAVAAIEGGVITETDTASASYFFGSTVFIE